MPNGHVFRDIECLRRILTRWDDCREIIIEAFELGGLKEVQELTGLKSEAARKILVRFGVLERRPCDKNGTIDQILEEQERQNRIQLEQVWGWKQGDETLVLTKVYERVAKFPFKCGNRYVEEGCRFLQYTLPNGGARRHMERNGLKWFQAGSLIMPVDKIGHWAVWSVVPEPG